MVLPLLRASLIPDVEVFFFIILLQVCGFFENCSAKDLTTCFGPVIESGKDLALLQRVLKHLFEDVFESEATEDAASSQLSASCPLVAYLVSSPVTRFGDGSVLAFLKEGWQSKTVCLPHTVRQYMETNPELRGVLPVDCCKAKDSKKRARDE